MANEDIDAINKMREDTVTALSTNDVESWLSAWTEDAVIMPPNEMPIAGHDAIGKWGRAFFDQMRIIEFWRIPKEITVADDWAYAWGHFEGKVVARTGGEPLPMNIKYLEILRKQSDQSWKIWRHMFSDNVPSGGT